MTQATLTSMDSNLLDLHSREGIPSCSHDLARRTASRSDGSPIGVVACEGFGGEVPTLPRGVLSEGRDVVVCGGEERGMLIVVLVRVFAVERLDRRRVGMIAWYIVARPAG